MIPVRIPSSNLRPIDRRSGVVAFNEVLVVFAVVAGLVLLKTMFLSAVSIDPNSAATNSRTLSERPIHCISLDRDGRRLWVARPREGVARLNVATRELDQSLPLSELELVVSAFSRDGSTALLCGADATAVHHRNGEEPRVVPLMPGELIIRACVCDDGSVSACATASGRIHIWTRHEAEFQGFTYQLLSDSAVLQIGLDRAGRRIYVARSDGTISFHASQTGEPDGSSLRVEAGCVAFAWSHDECYMGVVTSHGRVNVHDVATGRISFDGLVDEDYQHNPTCAASAILQFSPDGKRIATSAIATNQIRIWDLETGQSLGTLSGHDAPVRTLQFSPMSDVLYSGSYDGTVREWSLQTYSQLRMID